MNISSAVAPESWRWLVLAACMVSAGFARTEGEKIQSLAAIEQTVEMFVREQLQTAPEVTDIQVTPPDPRLRLSACTTELETFLPPGARFPGNTTIGVRCPTRPGWKLYVPVSVKVFGEVLVARQALARGTTLTADHVELVRHDLGRMRGGYVTDPQRVVGKKLMRPVKLGGILTPRMLETPHVVRRGQRVTILAGRPGRGLEVRMPGKALSNGRPGETIRVQNLSSKRIVEGTVDYDGTVRVRL